MIVGTIDFMAPEQAASAKLADHRSDIYSLGMTLWFLLTGRPAYESESVIEKLLAHREQPVPSLMASGQHVMASGLRELAGNSASELDAIFQKMVAKRPEDRYQSMTEVAVALEAFQHTHPASGSTLHPLSDATIAWVRPSGGGNLTQRHGGAEELAVATGAAIDAASGNGPDQTVSLLSPQSETTFARRKAATISTHLFTQHGCGVALSVTVSVAAVLLVSVGLWRFSPSSRRRLSELNVNLEAPVGAVGAHAGSSSSVPAPANVDSVNPKSKIENLKSASGFALEFNGKDTFVDLPTLHYDGSHPITIEATIVAHQIVKRGTVIGNRGSGGMGLNFPVGDTGPISSFGTFRVTDVNGVRDFYSHQSVRPGSRLHVAGVLDSLNASLFIDGKQQDNKSLSATYEPGRNEFAIGGNPRAGSELATPFSGLIDELRISKIARYTTDFTPQSRFEPDSDTLSLYHFDEGQGDVLIDSSGNNHHGKIVNARWVPGIAGGPSTQ
jgi:eukaryotic-like serine/threonine-protein kinase